MEEPMVDELYRRTLVKSLLWRLTGIVWTWSHTSFTSLFRPLDRIPGMPPRFHCNLRKPTPCC